MKIQHSEQRTQHVVGAVAARHGLPRAQLQAVVADALEAALIYDHDRKGARGDSVRTDADSTPPARSAEDARAEAAAAMKEQYKVKHGTGGSR